MRIEIELCWNARLDREQEYPLLIIVCFPSNLLVTGHYWLEIHFSYSHKKSTLT